jgi:alpha-glucoside transport system substrate-binding protein
LEKEWKMHKKTSWVIFTVLITLSFIIAACAGAAPTATQAPAAPVATEAPAAGEKPYAGETVTIFSAAGEEQAKVMEQNFVDFEASTGIDVVVEGSPDFETLSVARAEAGDPYDIMNFPQPGLMASMARDGFLIDLGQFITQDDLAQHYTQSWIDLGTVDGKLVGIWHTADVKSLVWYPKPAFDAAGYQIPQTWDELLALSDQIMADGTAPWCIGIESGAATGWPGTDWVEDIMLRTASPEKYDQWVRGELKFSSPEVKNAFQTMGDIWFKEGYVLGGTTSILSTNFGDAPLPLFDDPPSCFLHRQASFIPNFFPEGTKVGEDVAYFYLPPIDPQFGKPVLGSGNLISMGKDTPAIREVVKFLITPESTKAEVEAGNALASQKDAPLDWYPSDVQRGYAQILQGATTFRFDGSDLMPGAVGAGSFWTGIVDYVGGGDLDTILKTIDDSWPSQ